jgi:hypothetical protein
MIHEWESVKVACQLLFCIIIISLLFWHFSKPEKSMYASKGYEVVLSRSQRSSHRMEH